MKLSTPHGHGFFHHGFFGGDDLYTERGIHRGWLATMGVVFLLAGVLGLAMVSLMTIASVIFFGIVAIVGGIVQLAVSFTYRSTGDTWIGALIGALYLLAGLILVADPVAGSAILTLLLATALIGLGIMRIVYWIQHRTHRHWFFAIVSGAVSIALGIIIILQWPVSGLWVIGLFVALELIFHGATALALAFEPHHPV